MFNFDMNNNGSSPSQSPADADEDPLSRSPRRSEKKSLLKAVVDSLSSKSDTTLRETIEEYIEDQVETPSDDQAARHEKELLSNILQLRDLTVQEIMVPRADIQALEVSASKEEILKFFSSVQVSRVPVYNESLDDVWGTVHIKDVLSALAQGHHLRLEDLVSDIPVISPSMPVLDLLLDMRQSRRHMALVVDEYGGIDGLITMGDVLEAIVGEIDDEHDRDDDPKMVATANGSILADARVELEDFCERYGDILSEEEIEENDTLGGLLFYLAGRVPARGEVFSHPSGAVFEVIDADPRRIHRVRIRNLPSPSHAAV